MKKVLRVLIYGLPVLLIALAGIMNLAVDSAGDPVFGSTLLAWDMGYGTLISPVFMYFILAMVGIALINNKKEETQSIGKAFYGVAMISGFFIYKDVGLAYGFISETDIAAIMGKSFGGILLLASALLGIALALSFLLIPIIDEVVSKIYGKSITISSGKTAKDPFSKLRQWKELLDENVVSEEEYNQIKVEVLSTISLKKGSLLEIVTSLKSVEQEGIITTKDFEDKKKEVLG